MAFNPERPNRDQNPKFTLLSETSSIPAPFLRESIPPPPPGGAMVAVTLKLQHSRKGHHLYLS